MLELKHLQLHLRLTSPAFGLNVGAWRAHAHGASCDYVISIAHAQHKNYTQVLFMMENYYNIDSYSVMKQLFLQLVWSVAPLSQTPPQLSGASPPSSSSVQGTHSSPWGCATHCTT